uniref:ADP-ribosylation factor-like protein 5 n=1 Tax=Oryza barthii TaxID=65489 RepID=A0A0D3HNG9_9ORYZ
MGAWMSRVWFLMFPAKEYKIVVVGLDNAGKTTTLYKLHLGEAVTAAPTIGSNVEEVVFKNIRFEVSSLLPSPPPLFAFFSSLAKFRPTPDLTNDRVAVADLLLCCSVVVVVWDLGGQESLRTSWATYYRGTHAVIVVIDSTDRARINIIKDELFRLLQHGDLEGAVVLVFANKQDLKDAMSPAEITDALSLHSIKNHDWHIQASCAITGEGLYDGLGWIAQKVAGKATTS